ncbi:MAG: hypothetical protein A2V85_14930 [Chloroflexi bacterium RBG_16_72_14]|nr:MAG: hypothetical protein A2V85_14930 [Chloroflexi bacterium RBG_16_72_14]
MTMIAARSCAIIQPIATRPWRLSSSPRSSSTLNTTSVELIDTAAPITTAAVGGRPSARTARVPTSATIRTWSRAPGITIERTLASSCSENSTPSANRSSTTPSSASSEMRSTSPTNPGVNGPMITPAAR